MKNEIVIGRSKKFELIEIIILTAITVVIAVNTKDFMKLVILFTIPMLAMYFAFSLIVSHRIEYYHHHIRIVKGVFPIRFSYTYKVDEISAIECAQRSGLPWSHLNVLILLRNGKEKRIRIWSGTERDKQNVYELNKIVQKINNRPVQ